jgi:hypothetical protein
VVARVQPSPAFDSWVTWLRSDPPARTERDEAEWDRALLDAAVPRTTRPEARRIAGLYLLARLGEDYALRTRVAWERSPAEPDHADARWRAWLCGERTTPPLGLRRPVRAAFRGVARAGGLPPQLATEVADRASAACIALPRRARRALAAYVIETTGDPLSALERVVRPAQGDLSRLTERRLTEDVLEGLRAGQLDLGPTGLPGWPHLARGHARVRARFRQVVRDTAALPDALASVHGLSARVDTAARRWAWDWAERESRSGFPFSAVSVQGASGGIATPPG